MRLKLEVLLDQASLDVLGQIDGNLTNNLGFTFGLLGHIRDLEQPHKRSLSLE